MDEIRKLIKSLGKTEYELLMAAFNREDQLVLFVGKQFIACHLDPHRVDLVIEHKHGHWAAGKRV